ncbi:family 16 glycosylhydrolase [Christiangramia sp. SM2212]|uniref:Family 16 glycosylhydrolase n=1 Tax=Christiangramia sediminicola TaxID=3073267 RepID=A0ABU1ES18_9FLAO|nr:family 16 glycosylhydrolase [Christiangramia sp. SM2212]MDR5591194.1 family 16 glycosylhydrolase [Christiangramia sp. SM2212]
MKMIKKIGILVLLFGLFSCQEDDLTLDTIMVPADLSISSEISDDGSGLVEFNASATNALTYKFNFSDGSSAVAPNGNYTKRFTRTGLNTYLVTVVAYGQGGVSSSKSVEVEVRSDFSDPDTKEFLTGGNSKTWYVASAQAGHLGVGPSEAGAPDFYTPTYYTAAPFEKAGDELSSCFYTDEITFSESGENITYELNNNGFTFFNVDYAGEFGGSAGQDECLALDTSGEKSVTLAPASSGIPADASTQTEIQIGGGGFMSYYIGASNYEVLSITENTLYVRAVMGNNPALAWYVKFTTTPYAQQSAGGGAEEPEPEPFQTQFEDLAWSDEFDGDALDTSVWNYEIGNGTDGWGNNEVQYYKEENVTVQDGSLFITAKRESESGFDFTSGRITTQDNYEFTYGRIEARAKMPEGGGTWPAIWMLGANFDEVGWPETGEIDIMEWVGNNPGETSSALHYPGNSGGNAVVGRTEIANASTEFHTYTVEWTSENIILLLDGEEFFTFTNEASLPFNKDFFLIMNVAMGGGLGGEIADDFQESSMEVDYIRIYQ